MDVKIYFLKDIIVSFKVLKCIIFQNYIYQILGGKKLSMDMHITCINSFQEISIKIKNINEEPYGMTLSGSHTVLANGTTGYSIGEVTVLDPDVEQTHIISIKGPNSDFIKAIYLSIPVKIFK